MTTTILMTSPDWTVTDLTEYAYPTHVRELLERRFPYQLDTKGRRLQYFAIKVGRNGFIRIEAPEALTEEEKQSLYERYAALQQESGLDSYD